MAKNVWKKGGKYGNKNAMKHGGYMTLSSDYLDGRTRVAKLLGEIEANLSTSIGGDPSPQEILIIKRAAVKAFRCAQIEAVIVTGNVSESAESDYLRWSKELRLDLCALGLERRARDVQSLTEYLQKKQS